MERGSPYREAQRRTAPPIAVPYGGVYVDSVYLQTMRWLVVAHRPRCGQIVVGVAETPEGDRWKLSMISRSLPNRLWQRPTEWVRSRIESDQGGPTEEGAVVPLPDAGETPFTRTLIASMLRAAALYLLLELIAAGFERIVGLTIPLFSIGFQWTLAATSLLSVAIYLPLAGRARDVRRVFGYNSAFLRGLGAIEAGEELTIESLARQPTFHPMSSAVFILLMVVVQAALMTGVTSVVPAPSGFFSAWLALGALYGVMSIPARCVTGPIQVGLARAYRVPSLRTFIRLMFWPTRLVAPHPERGELEVAVAALRELRAREQASQQSASGRTDRR